MLRVIKERFLPQIGGNGDESKKYLIKLFILFKDSTGIKNAKKIECFEWTIGF